MTADAFKLKQRTSLRGARVVVVGLGKSGVAAASLCARAGASVLGIDGQPVERLSSDAQALASQGVELRGGGLEPFDYADSQLVVVSPGVPSFAALRDAELRGARVIGEIELASWFLPQLPILAVTGSNGKSTTVTLLGELLRAMGRTPFVGGNLGDPPCAFVSPEGAFPYDVVVLEVSSFQAERVPSFRANATALLNVSPNHLDRYDDFAGYVRAKGNLFQNQVAGDLAVVPADDPLCVKEAQRGGARLLRFGSAECTDADIVFTRTEIVDRVRGFALSREEIPLPGDHNALNVCAALALLNPWQPDVDVLRRALADFKGLPHRIVKVLSYGGVNFYDDSKGTNVGATVAAIRGLPETKVVLIAGGRDKLGSYEPLAKAMLERGRAAILIGEAAEKIGDALSGSVAVTRAATMTEAVERAAQAALPGDAVLLSPACSSFDMFRDYKHRGDTFVEAAQRLVTLGLI
jgi:UDP-N-acetylmuramoylalanine--D-glutamate ligase